MTRNDDGEYIMDMRFRIIFGMVYITGGCITMPLLNEAIVVRCNVANSKRIEDGKECIESLPYMIGMAVLPVHLALWPLTSYFSFQQLNHKD